MPATVKFTDRQKQDASGPGLSGYELDAHFSNSAELPTAIRRFRVGTTAGNVKVQYADGTDHTIPAVQLYEKIDAHIVKIYVTGTTAVGLSGWT